MLLFGSNPPCNTRGNPKAENGRILLYTAATPPAEASDSGATPSVWKEENNLLGSFEFQIGPAAQ
jgi:hypothetical protein